MNAPETLSADHRMGSPAWSKRRKAAANSVASVLYGVVAIMSAELGVQPGEFTPLQGAIGAVLVGLAMALTRLFVEVVKHETELGSHVRIWEGLDILRVSLLAMVFPTAVAAWILIGSALGVRRGFVLEALPYVSELTVFILGFGSSFILDGQTKRAFLRAVSWALLSLVLFAAKQLE
jgi:hypothetical protein